MVYAWDLGVGGLGNSEWLPFPYPDHVALRIGDCTFPPVLSAFLPGIMLKRKQKLLETSRFLLAMNARSNRATWFGAFMQCNLPSDSGRAFQAKYTSTVVSKNA